MTLAEQVLARDRAAVARLIRLIDDRQGGHEAALRELYPHTGRAELVGVTGAPGAGKSTLVDGLIQAYRQQGKTVGVLAVDPSSPFTGGAILGDRIRMNRHALDPGVFIRSLATRGHLGGLSRSAMGAAAVLDAAGFDVLLLETVGVGQDEVEVARLAHTTVVVTVPESGDHVQTLKAGVLEVADVFAVNKADRPGADGLANDIATMVRMPGGRQRTWDPPVVRTVGTTGEGMAELLAAIAAHQAHLAASGEGAARLEQRAREAILGVVRDRVVEAVIRGLGEEIRQSAARLGEGRSDPFAEAEALLATALARRLLAVDPEPPIIGTSGKGTP